MDEYPDPEEEYEMLHLEEMEALIDMEKEMLMAHQGSRPKKSKNSLNFDDLDLSYENEKRNILEEDTSKNSSVSHDIRSSRLKKRILSTGSLMDMTSDLDVIEHQPKKFRYDISVNQTSEYELNNEFGTTSFRVPKWPFITISTNLGDRLYVKLRDNQEDDEMSAYCKSQSTRNNLLETPYSTLRSLVEESFKSRLINEEIEKLPLDGQGEIQDHSGLWVEKFKPQTYFDLLSDEAVNRTLLNWLKMWDKIVFNKELSEKILIKSNLNKENDFKIDVNKLDADGRPHYKIALLCGPPGLGKTTLAHIAVHMAGYNAIEMNASDDRSIESLKTKLDNATQMQAVMGACKPSCLILDEIDGAPIQTVDFLLKYINSKINEKTKNQKKDKPIKILKRPIICICNELYTPSLRQLRQQAFVIHFPNTSSTKLAQRLMEICRKQDIKTDVSALTLLCDKAQNDIRSCISTLHFFKKQSGQRFKSADVLNSSMGLKDMQKSAFSIWKEIFQNPMKRLGIFSKALNKATEDEVSSHVNYSKKGMDQLKHIVEICQSSGDYDRLMEGVYENFLKSKYIGTADSILNGLDWFCWFDVLNTAIKKHQNYSLLTYLPYSFGMWQLLFSSHSFWKINYPNVAYENRTKEAKCDQILNDVCQGLNSGLKAFNGKNSLLYDSLPIIDVILKPSLRPVDPKLFNEGEKKDFKHLIDVMVDFNLNYIQHRSTDGTYSYQLDPNVEELVKFNTNNSNNTRSHSYNLKQIISHELELEKVRRTEGSQNIEKSQSEKNNENVAAETKVLKSAARQSKEITIKEKDQYKDFFGRIVTRKECSVKGSQEKNTPVKSPIWFVFKEGYNNAVKKDVTVGDLL